MRTALEAAVGFGAALAWVMALVMYAAASIHDGSTTILYDQALVLRPTAIAFETVPTGLTAGLDPVLFRDAAGLVVEASSIDGDHAVLRWNGTSFVPGTVASTPGLPPIDDDLDVSLTVANGARIQRPSDDEALTLTTPDGATHEVALPEGYALRTLLSAGGARVLLVPDMEETRTFFLDAGSGALTAGPPTPAYMSTIAASDRDGTVVILPGRTVATPTSDRSVLSLIFAAIGACGMVALGVLVARRRVTWWGALLGVGVAVVLGVLFVAGVLFLLGSVRGL
jgi:hypothetical protein